MNKPVTVYLNVQPDSVLVQLPPAEADGVTADADAFIEPGEKFMGYTFEELKALGSGEHRITPR
jgi:hypothetical protein